MTAAHFSAWNTGSLWLAANQGKPLCAPSEQEGASTGDSRPPHLPAAQETVSPNQTDGVTEECRGVGCSLTGQLPHL